MLLFNYPLTKYDIFVIIKNLNLFLIYMDFQEYWEILSKKRKQTLFLFVILSFSAFLSFSLIKTPQYAAESRILVKQNNTENKDAYNVSRSNVYFTDIFINIIHSESFLREVLGSGFNIDKRLLGETEILQKEKWQASVSAEAVGNTGIIRITTYNREKYLAKEINEAIIYVYKTKHDLYHGFGDKISIEILNAPSASKWPVRPNIALNGFLGIVAGALLGMIFIYLYPDKNLRFYSKKKKKAIKEIKGRGAIPLKKVETGEKSLREGLEEDIYKADVYYKNSNIREENMPEGNMNNLL